MQKQQRTVSCCGKNIANIAKCIKAILMSLLILRRASVLSEWTVHYNAAYQALVAMELDRNLLNHVVCLQPNDSIL